MSIKEQTKKFNKAWERLAEEGKCDARGGCEYKRVKEEWSVYEGSLSLDDFIVRQANCGPVLPSPRVVPELKTVASSDNIVLLSWFQDQSEMGTRYYTISDAHMNELLTKKQISRLIEYSKTKHDIHDCSLGEERTLAKEMKPEDPEDLLVYRVAKILRALKPHMTEITIQDLVKMSPKISLVVECSYL